MLDIKRIREDREVVQKGLESRGADTAVIERVCALDGKRRAMLAEVETLKSERNRASKEIGQLKKDGKDIEKARSAMRELGDRIAESDKQIRVVDEELRAVMLTIPNVPHVGIPIGADSKANRFVRAYGEPKKFNFKAKTHVELGETLGILDLTRAARMSGAGFPLFVREGARLERALINFMLDLHVKEHGYTEIAPPVLCNAAAMTGTGQLPKMAEDMYYLKEDNLYMIPTAEVPVTNYYMDEIITEALPLRMTAYTPCFRREAGAAGKETRGIIRVHQFDKVEMVKFVEPETSYNELELLLGDAEDVLRRLGLPYRIMELCTGDISFAAAKCYDIELWAPGQNDWLEVSSCSNFEDFQARRIGIRYRDGKGRIRFVHTLNGSGVALARLLVAILENGQQEDGSIVLPENIIPYMDGMKEIRKPGS
ncbi:MAG: serine--tRNA ligase [Lentisphaerae bacterium]|nr:serine--tRNA ligase [Lentisphaerota bacterium]